MTAQEKESGSIQFASGQLKISGTLEGVLEALRKVLPERVSLDIRFEQE